jgi:hypothetical protein
MTPRSTRSGRAARALVLATGLVLTLGGHALVSAAPTSPAAAMFRDMFGLPAAREAFANSAISPTSKAKWSVELTAAEEADLDARAVLQEQLNDVAALADANRARLGGTWLDQRAGGGHGFVVMVAFVGSVDVGLMSAFGAAAPAGTARQSTIVTRSMSDLEALEDKAATAAETNLDITGVSLAPQENAVLVHTLDGQLPAELAGIAGYKAVLGGNQEIGCRTYFRCSLRPYRGGMEIQDKFTNDNGTVGWEECTSAFTVKRSNGAYALLTAAHCQMDYTQLDTTWTLNNSIGTVEPVGNFGADTVPSNSLFCLTVCDMDSETQLINNVILPSSKNIIAYSSSEFSRAITGYSSYSSSWVGRSICAVGISSDQGCGTITSVGSASINMRKEHFTARINKGGYASLTIWPKGGDSGGPVLSGGIAYGTNTAVTGSGYLFFSALSPALSNLGVTLCTTSAC